jgi:hypothetical protein
MPTPIRPTKNDADGFLEHLTNDVMRNTLFL